MRKKRIIRYFTVALISIVIVVSIRACIDVRKSIDAAFLCLRWYYPSLDSTDMTRDPSSQVIYVTAYISAVDPIVQRVPMKYFPITRAYASTGSFLTYESYEARVEPVTDDTMQHVVKFDVPHEGNWTLNVHFTYEMQDVTCNMAETYEIFVPK